MSHERSLLDRRRLPFLAMLVFVVVILIMAVVSLSLTLKADTLPYYPTETEALAILANGKRAELANAAMLRTSTVLAQATQANSTQMSKSGQLNSSVTVNGYPGSTLSCSAKGFTSAASMLDAWMGSYCKDRLLSASAADIGVGLSNSYWTVVIGTPSVPPANRSLSPMVTSISPSSARKGEEATFSGARFGTEAGSVIFNQSTVSASIVSWSPTQVRVRVPYDGMGGIAFIRSKAGEYAGINVYLLNPTSSDPYLWKVAPQAAKVGDTVSLNSANLGGTMGKIYIGNQSITPSYWSVSGILVKFTVTASMQSGDVYAVRSDGKATNRLPISLNGTVATPTPTISLTPSPTPTTTFTPTPTPTLTSTPGVNTPTITSISPAYGPVGTTVTITGNFPPTSATYSIVFNGIRAAVVTSNGTTFTVKVPQTSTGLVTVRRVSDSVSSNGVNFVVGNVTPTPSPTPSITPTPMVTPTPAVTPPNPSNPSITSITPSSGVVGSTVSIKGSFPPVGGTYTIVFNGIRAAVATSNGSSFTVKVPSTTSGPVFVRRTSDSVVSNSFAFSIPLASLASPPWYCYILPSLRACQ